MGPDANGCASSAKHQLIVAPLLINDSVSQITCYGNNNGSIATTISGGTGPYLYTWSSGDVAPSLNNLSPGTYTLHVKDNTTQCTAHDSFNITQPDSLLIIAHVNNDTCRAGQGNINIEVTGGTTPYHYLWWNNATSNYITGLHAGTYTLAVTDQNNCKQNSSFTVDDTCTSITVRTGVSPNGDGINDTWIIDGIQDYPKNKVQVFDKWGDMVYEKENYNNDWGGRSIKGELVPDGTYYYLVKLNAPNAPEGNEVFKGALLIKR